MEASFNRAGTLEVLACQTPACSTPESDWAGPGPRFLESLWDSVAPLGAVCSETQPPPCWTIFFLHRPLLPRSLLVVTLLLFQNNHGIQVTNNLSFPKASIGVRMLP